MRQVSLVVVDFNEQQLCLVAVSLNLKATLASVVATKLLFELSGSFPSSHSASFGLMSLALLFLCSREISKSHTKACHIYVYGAN